MRWHGFTGLKYYASAAIALIGVSAASTLLTDRVSLAQQPKVEEKVKAADELEGVFETLSDKLGADHPQVKAIRKQIEAARAQARKAAGEALEADSQARKAAIDADDAKKRRVVVQNFSGSPAIIADLATSDGDVLTENVIGNQSIVVRRTADGQEIHEVLASAPKEVRGFSWLGNPKQNSELQKAVEKYQGKDTSDADKAAAKEKIVSILGQQFDDDMKQRSTQIAELEKKVATLKEQIEKRKGAKSRMIDLRLEMIINESEGLGFPSSWQQPAGVGPVGASTLFPGGESRTVVRALGLPTTIPPVPPVAPVAPVPPASPAPPTADK